VITGREARPLTIVFAFHPGAGHINSSLTLARPLRERGHRIVYYGLADARPFVIEAGFEFVSFAEEIVPGHGLHYSAPRVSWWRRRLAQERHFAAFLGRCADGTIDRQLQSLNPDLVVCDSLVWYIALRALRLRLPTAGVSTLLCGPPNPHSPPVLYSRLPRDSPWGRTVVRADWARMRVEFFFTSYLASLLLGRYRTPARVHRLTNVCRRLARQAGVPCREGVDYWFGVAGPHLMLPEILICPRSFDLTSAPDIGRRYLAGVIDGFRPEDTGLLDQLNRGKPLVYCSLGSDSHLYPHSTHFFDIVAEASRLRPQWQWVLSVGPHVDPDHFRAGANLAVVKWAPQMALLHNAAVMVTHGGLNSVMECIHLGVPMVVVPGLRDQPGNMVRAVSHGVAVGASMRGLQAHQLAAKVAYAMGSQEMRRALAKLRESIATENGLPAALELLESLAGKP